MDKNKLIESGLFTEEEMNEIEARLNLTEEILDRKISKKKKAQALVDELGIDEIFARQLAEAENKGPAAFADIID